MWRNLQEEVFEKPKWVMSNSDEVAASRETKRLVLEYKIYKKTKQQ
jgi:hypothetical protein